MKSEKKANSSVLHKVCTESDLSKIACSVSPCGTDLGVNKLLELEVHALGSNYLFVCPTNLYVRELAGTHVLPVFSKQTISLISNFVIFNQLRA